MIETETPMDEIVMIETQTSVVSDVSDTKQLHTQSPKIDCQRHSHVHDAQQHNLFSVSSAASAACRLKFMNTIQPQRQIN
jgi:t-SNARE complex subunit (syntaxin)